MDWIKMYTDADMDPKIKLIRRVYGFAGEGRWWALCRIIGKELDVGDVNCFATYHIKDWAISLGLKVENCKKFVGFLKDNCGISLTYSEDLLTVTIPKILELRDSRNGARAKRGSKEESRVEKEEEREEDRNVPASPAAPEDEKIKPKIAIPESWVQAVEMKMWPKDKKKFIDYGAKHGLDAKDSWRVFEYMVGTKVRTGIKYNNWMRVYQDSVRFMIKGDWNGPAGIARVVRQCNRPNDQGYDENVAQEIKMWRARGLTDDQIREKGIEIGGKRG